jgi:outer membrane protein OmpA-like peptidoglycan-associated protein
VPKDEPVRVVHFAPDSDVVDAADAKVLDEVAARAKELGDVQVNVSGHTDQSEGEGDSPEYRVGLSQRRASNVRAALGERGVKDGIMTTEAFGQRSPGDFEGAKQRRVEIRFSEGAGW